MKKLELRKIIREVISRNEMYELEDKYPKAKDLKTKVITLTRKEVRKMSDDEVYAFSQIMEQWYGSLV